nr:MmgE/PrpD family protein [Afifella sp. IM 167]
MAARSDLSRVTDGLGEDFDLRVNTYKPFPCGIVNHPSIDACIQLKEENGLDSEAIKAVRLTVAPLVIDLCGKQGISTGLQGKFSVVHGAAVGLVRGRAGLDEYTDETVNDPEVKRVREATTRTGDASISEDGVHVEVELKDGKILTKALQHSLGNLERPMSDEQLSAKFRNQGVRALPADQVEQLLQACWRVDTHQRMADVIAQSVPK